MAEIKDLSNTDASNTGRFPESQAPSTVNNGARALEGMISRAAKDTFDGWIITGGTGSAYTATPNRSFTASTTMYDGAEFSLQFSAVSANSATLNVGSTDARKIFRQDGTTISASDILTGSRAVVKYNSSLSGWILMNEPVPAKNIPANIPANSITGDKIAMGSDAQGDILYYNGTDYARLAAGTSGQYLKTQGSGANPTWANLGTLGTAVALSGSSTTTFSSLPAGLNYIVITFNAVSNGSTDNILVQIGDSGGLETTGYTSASSDDVGSDVSSTAGFIVSLSGTAANVVRGVLWLVRSTGNVWVSSHSGMIDQDEGIHGGGARTTLDSALDRVAVLSTASNNFDGGTVNIVYW